MEQPIFAGDAQALPMSSDLDSSPVTELRGSWPDGLLSALTPMLPLLADEQVTEIEANGFDDVWIKGSGWRGHRRADGVGWTDRADFEIACIRISDVIGRSLSRRTPLLNARLPGGERVRARPAEGHR